MHDGNGNNGRTQIYWIRIIIIIIKYHILLTMFVNGMTASTVIIVIVIPLGYTEKEWYAMRYVKHSLLLCNN